MHKRYSQREVDLYATSQAAEAKLKKKARVEQELQDAIAALKKPNPRVAVKELVEDAERRATASHPRSRTCSPQVFLVAKHLQSLRIRFAILLPKALKSSLRQATRDVRTSTAVFRGKVEHHCLS